ncbi:hypothetical protein P152DRAFT_80164 [Eremomyces bilateralis CBS 781.70]|uniref:Integral membrane protein n=1 Tax=Eremomyces bilateralis CBS 781.70 TaxID=1392243 RepID=A0A6G1FZM1_9PEZI|nr:uncharacterized protein P152DRAFT_80164 [Eremomyces bilateralis CBS 781.70]KAF1811131.1 hypothetical protein P152DRAFT_80164 [Eremomyces bilateralis CBS 781.70]
MVSLPFKTFRISRTSANGAVPGDSVRDADGRTTNKEEKGLPNGGRVSKTQIKRATQTRKTFGLISSFCLLISFIFLIIVNIGSIRPSGALADIYFLRIDLSNIVPQSIPNAVLLNSIAQTLGLHDYYQTGLWNFCEGYVNQGISACSKPHSFYWFNPVEILLDELLAGASVALPADILDVLDILNLASNWMFALFLFGTVVTFVMIFLVPLTVYSRWVSLVIGTLTVISMVAVVVASVVATVMFIIFRNSITQVAELNIDAEIGKKMFALMWIASAFSVIAALIQMGLCCCCASRRDVKTGRKRGNEKAYSSTLAVSESQGRKRGFFGRRKNA